jgi:hypothetical protein
MRIHNPDHTLNRTEAWERLDYWLKRTENNQQEETFPFIKTVDLLVKLLREDENERGGQ